ncbi:MAG: hypothetical protein ACRETB_11370 [Steroidobacteraceae bacterium]
MAAGTLAALAAVGLSRPASADPSLQEGPLTLTFGGFTELATLYRNRNEVADVGSDFNSGIPYYDNPQSQVSEFRFSARQSRFSLLAQGQEFDGLRAEAYLETDFLGAAGTANSRESNSYNLRMRVFYGRFTTDYGLDVLLGQNWSLATLYKHGLAPRSEDAPLSIDAQYVVGFNWTRSPQVRVVEHFSKAFSLGLSLESPQTVTGNGGITCAGLASGASCAPSDVDYQNSGNAGGLNNPDTTYTTDIAPDVILKAAFDPGFGHYEVYGLSRWFRSSVARSDDVASGGGVGAGMSLPILPKRLSFQATGLVGKGIGRYGSSQMPDVTMQPSGALAPLSEYEVLLGLILTPTNRLTVYGYTGREKESAKYYTVGAVTYGYGAPTYNNSGCYATSGPCVANTHSIDEVTAGMWWKYYEGQLGNLQFGLQAEYFQKNAFAGIGGAPSANMFVGMASFRYYPYQH